MHEDRLPAYDRLRSELLRALRRLSDAVPGAVDWQAPGIQALAGRPGLPLVQQGLPILAVALCGPTGAGKSTLFRRLTGLDVPAGDVERPVTHSTCLAIPSPLMGALDLKAAFPEYARIEPLRNPGDLRRARADDVLFYQAYETPPDARVWVLPADCPDFNSVELSNWAKAVRMMSRADVTIFMSDRFAYVDKPCVEKLAQICGVGGKLIYVITRAERDEAERVWAHLVEITRALPDFAALRADGRARHEYLREAAVYYSPFARRGEELSVQSLAPGGGALDAGLRGEDGQAAIVAGLRESAFEGIKDVRAIMARVSLDRDRRAALLDQARESLARELRLEGIYPFPLGALLSYIMNMANEIRPVWLQWTMKPLTWALVPARRLMSLVGQLKKMLRKADTTGAVEIERRSVRESLRRLLDIWRAAFPAQMDAAACAGILAASDSWPPPDSSCAWSETVQQEVRAWLRDRKWIAYAGVVNDLLFVIGSAFVLVDVATTTALGIVVPGAITAAGGLILKLIEEVSLGSVYRTAQREWRERRADAWRAWIWERAARPLFAAPLEESIRRMDEGGGDIMASLCDAMETCLELKPPPRENKP